VTKRKQAFHNGDTIFREGAPSNRAYEIISGAVELSRQGKNGPIRVAMLDAGDLFGEMGLVEGGAQNSTARAVGSIMVNVIERETKIGGDGNNEDLLGRLMGQSGTTVSAGGQGASESLGVFAFDELKGSKLSSDRLGLIRRIMESVTPVTGRIEVRVAPIIGDAGGKIAGSIASALNKYREIRAKVLNKPLAVNPGDDFAHVLPKIAASAREWLKARDGDLMIWGHSASPETSVNLHFIAGEEWDERMYGSFDLATELILPAGVEGQFSDFLYAAILAATVPSSTDMSANIKSALPIAAQYTEHTICNLPNSLVARERAGFHLCYGNILGATWILNGDIGMLCRAVNAYRNAAAAADEDESNDAPRIKAIANLHLSGLLITTAKRNADAQLLEQAAKAAKTALEFLNYETSPREWALLQYRLGIITYKQGFSEGDSYILRKSLRYHQNSLRVYTHDKLPDQWAEVMGGFAKAMQVFGEYVQSLEALATAASACRAVLEVRRKSQSPLAWAATQNNLGSALFLLGRKARSPKRLEAAVEAFELANRVYQSRDMDRMAAITEKNLERALTLHDAYISGNLLALADDEVPEGRDAASVIEPGGWPDAPYRPPKTRNKKA
jgi:hypothetical protein